VPDSIDHPVDGRAQAGRRQASPPLDALDWAHVAEETLRFYRRLER